MILQKLWTRLWQRKWGMLLSLVILFIAVYAVSFWVDQRAKGNTHTEITTTPAHKVALLLGTGKQLKSGAPNPFYTARIAAAYDLYKAGKWQYLVISGDNSRKDYSEPEDMKADLLVLGVPDSCIYLDYAGFDTYDSMFRMREIFGQRQFLVISQSFHNHRALFMAQSLGLQVQAYHAADPPANFSRMVNLREYLARVKMLLELALKREPHFLGEPVNIP